MINRLLKQPIVRIVLFVIVVAVALQVMPVLLPIAIGFVVGANSRSRNFVTTAVKKAVALN